MKNKQTNEWIKTLGLSGRSQPDLFLSPEDIVGAPHAAVMRVGFKELGLAGFFCINSIPTVAFLLQDELNTVEINKAHRALWNQGLCSLLLVILSDEIHAYSLVQKPVSEDITDPNFKDYRHIETFRLVADSLKVSQLLAGIESGRYFQNNKECFSEENRIDSVLLSNLKETEKRLVKKCLPVEAAQALLLQITFIAYLEDRKIIDADYFKRDLGSNKIQNLKELLDSHNPEHLKTLFNRLHKDFNGDMFFAPCSFVASESIPIIPEQIKCLAKFRHGLVEMDTGQRRFWPYDFRYIPVELISAIYDRFLADSKQRRATGAYYTPRYLADLTVNQIWDELPLEARTRADFNVLDPACGSAIFLVRIFQRMVEDWRRQYPKKMPSWRIRLSFTLRLHGWDKQPNAVRIGIFSLYIALLEDVEPSAIQALFDEGKILPPLFGITMCDYDFFDKNTPDKKFDLIIGNPPWVSRKKDKVVLAKNWCSSHNLPMPSEELAWAFIWKGLEHIKADGLIGFLLPAMGVFLNHGETTIHARNIWVERTRIKKVINFSDFRFQLFDGAIRPTALCLFKRCADDNNNYSLEHWCQKVDRLFQTTQMITLNSGDKIMLSKARVLENPNAWGQLMWMKNHDMKLLGWLSSLSKLGEKLATYAESKKKAFSANPKPWIIGQGFQPLSSEKDKPINSELVSKVSFLNANNFHSWVIPNLRLNEPLQTSSVRRLGFENGFMGSHVLIKKGLQANGLLRTAYSEQTFCFQDDIQSIRFPSEDASELKLLTVVLNSSFAAWFCFHKTSSTAAERPLVHEEQLLELPFPDIEELHDPESAREAKNAIIKIMDKLLQDKDQLLLGEFPSKKTVERLNQLVYRYYGLTKDEITVIEDTLLYSIPSIQPRRNKGVPLWETPKSPHWLEYMETLISSLSEGLQPGNYLSASLIVDHPDLAVLELSIQDVKPQDPCRIREGDNDFKSVLNKIHDGLKRPLSQNFQLIPNLRLFVDKSLYLIKPKTMRYWMKSSALNDADDIEGDLFSAKYQNKKLREKR